MSMIPPLDPLLLLLDDPALLAGLLAGDDPALAPAVVGPAAIAQAAMPQPEPQPEPETPLPGMPDDAFPTIEELDALLADSYAPKPGLDAALRADLAAALDLDPALVDDEDALIAALAALEPPPEDDLPELLSGAPSWDPDWAEPARADWALG